MVTSRYNTPEMASLWSETSQFHLWSMVEGCAATAKGAGVKITALLEQAPAPTAHEVRAFEQMTHHDVVAFTMAMRKSVRAYAEENPDRFTPEDGEEAANWVHRGLTSSDVVDSANGVRWGASCALIQAEGQKLVDALANHALKHRLTRRVGRTHGQWAEETSWGKLIADKAFQAERAVERLSRAFGNVARVKISGPVGDYKQTTRGEEIEFANFLSYGSKISVRAADSATQVVARDGLVELLEAARAMAAVVAGLALEVRISAQSEIAEVLEQIGSDQIGSSSMPHKRNPVTCEKIQGLYRVLSNDVNAAIDSTLLWGERDISHSSVERTAVVDALSLAHYLTRIGVGLVETITVDKEAMEANLLKARPVIRSSAALSWLVDRGVPRGEAWGVVADAAMMAKLDDSTVEAKTPVAARRLVHPSPALTAVNWAEMPKNLSPEPDPARLTHLWQEIQAMTDQGEDPGRSYEWRIRRTRTVSEEGTERVKRTGSTERTEKGTETVRSDPN